MIQLFTASTTYQVASLAAMIDSGILQAPEGERILVLANGSQLPELTMPITESPGFKELATRFDRVVDLGSLIWPRRTHQFSPRAEELGMWEALLRSHWSLGDEPLSLFVDSIQVNPAIALCRIFHDAPVSVHSDGLMAYGPTRKMLDRSIAQRLDSIVYPDLVPGLTPLLLSEVAPTLLAMDPAPLKAIFESMAASIIDPALESISDGTEKVILVVGQYLNSLGLLDEEGELELHRQMLVAAKERGADLVIFKPHPSASPTSAIRLGTSAEQLGLGFEVYEGSLGAEVVALKIRPIAVISCFSTALVTCSRLFDIPAHAVGTESLLQALAPFENSNRIPLTLADVLFAGPHDSVAQLQDLVNAVGYAMQPNLLPHLRGAAEAYLLEHPVEHVRYFKQRRLHRLNLHNTLPPASRLRPLKDQVRRVARHGVQRPARFIRKQLDRVL